MGIGRAPSHIAAGLANVSGSSGDGDHAYGDAVGPGTPDGGDDHACGCMGESGCMVTGPNAMVVSLVVVLISLDTSCPLPTDGALLGG